jgi:hypothetical protein
VTKLEIDKNTLSFRLVKEWWFILVVIFSLGGMFAQFSSADESATKRLLILEDQHKNSELVQIQIMTQLSQIQTDLQWIKTRIK